MNYARTVKKQLILFLLTVGIFVISILILSLMLFAPTMVGKIIGDPFTGMYLSLPSTRKMTITFDLFFITLLVVLIGYNWRLYQKFNDLSQTLTFDLGKKKAAYLVAFFLMIYLVIYFVIQMI